MHYFCNFFLELFPFAKELNIHLKLPAIWHLVGEQIYVPLGAVRRMIPTETEKIK